MSTRKRSTSGSKKQLKEKIVQMYEAFFRVSNSLVPEAVYHVYVFRMCVTIEIDCDCDAI